MVEAVAAGWSAAPSTLYICSLHAAHNACPSPPHLTANPFLSSAKPIYTTTVYNNKTKSTCCCTVSSFCFNAIPEHELGTESRERKLSHRKVKLSAGELGHGLGLQLPPRASAVSVNQVNFLRTSYLTSTALLGAGGGDFGKFGGGEGWGGDGGGGGHSLSTTLRATNAQTDDSNLTPEVEDVILLDVKGMSCGGCASSVKRILESQK
ncbi:hypothetical protein O6H91_07G029600 [Diphasiastrum complanatum]|uniref:Uncharacterized protein n=1 Tax=Diphasiastrum complanatum TaxID=34168 RepID=A0ACC2D3X5_DIPCM|nr:hypothetical protein O6H91_07G029600 [Diphasiastrum complanatum]